ncbi:sulfotransferase [Gluconobacter oxydans]|uniref:tetratricopeptide repeat-containing sulfotransferase family protein n=1 Tax=Gluconobacter thailandicus TaxID=257438 RepID=UPI000299A043|nr:sulfotransferase [Gluconobacter thailandicus]AFW02681.1 sulfotransferase [Gluconobacter oxydans H24]ANQ41854.1 sulfotransferase [Gluconobacter oxydans]
MPQIPSYIPGDISQPGKIDLKRVRALLQAGRPLDARQMAMSRAVRDPASAEARFLLGICEITLGRIRGGVEHLRKAISLAPLAEYHAQLARCLLMLRKDGEARSTLQNAADCLAGGETADALTHDTLGCAYARLGDHAASLPHFAAAVLADPGNAQFRYNQAIALSFVGDVEASENAFEALLYREPHNARAHHGLAGIRRQTAARNHVSRLRTVRNKARDQEARLLLGYALAKELEDVGDAQDSFRCLLDVNKEYRSRISYDFAEDARIFDALEASWPQCASAPVTEAPTEAPIFILGMPRTGTTLVDRILSSHPDVVSAGELQAFPLSVKAASGTRSRNVLDVETVLHAAGKDPGQIGRSYMERAASHIPPDGLRFVDKFPGNFHYAGLIARALPNAAILCLRRHPMDTVVSNFKNLFATTSRYYQYSYDLREIAQYYVRFDRLMAFWKKAVPGRILEVRYEDLVEDQERTTRRILEHCSLPWSESCLAFHENASPVSTPSAAQVRRPIYRDALARWRLHEEALAETRAVFEAAGIPVEPITPTGVTGVSSPRMS